MELERILLKIIANEELTAYEQSFLLDFFAALQRQNVTKLSDISFNAGDLVAGRFIAPAPTAKAEPTDSTFTGSFMSAAGETFGGTVYNIGGALLGVLQWGASQTTGKLIAGAGGVVIDENGIVIENSSGNIFFKDTTGVYDATHGVKISMAGSDGLQIINRGPGDPLSFFIVLTDASTPQVKWFESNSEANTALFQINASGTPTQVSIGGDSTIPGIKLRANKDGNETVFNETSFDIDFRIEGATDANLFKVDAGLDAIGIGGAAESGKKLKVTGDVNIRHILPFGVFTAISPFSGTSNPYSASIDRTLTFVRWSQTYYVATTNDGTNYWTIDLLRGDGSTIKSINTSAASANTDTLSQVTTFDIASVGTSDKLIYIRVTKTLAPGNLTLYGPTLEVTG